MRVNSSAAYEYVARDEEEAARAVQKRIHVRKGKDEILHDGRERGSQLSL